ncbi:hypothetical protein FSP39_021398 [Pinctada imbricata]|uniref:Impact N-terminal domain-containing protein n=1 Tax=Pinctada imbricata TaxID=66713 RepID=A0AA88YFF1_PINIB|nr:hypothetical protein FSP39_021398 [Pinctada imbricata]
MQKDGNTFIAEASIVKSVTEVTNLHWKVRCGRSTASADHHILVYRFKDERGKIHQSYHDDGEYGAGRRLLKYMINTEINNCAVVICRWKGNRFLGYDRFSIMEELVCMSTDELNSE